MRMAVSYSRQSDAVARPQDAANCLCFGVAGFFGNADRLSGLGGAAYSEAPRTVAEFRVGCHCRIPRFFGFPGSSPPARSVCLLPRP